MNESQSKTNRLLLGGGVTAVGTSLFTFEEASNAQSTASTAITQMNTDAVAIGSLVGIIQPIAVAAVVFAAAALLFKRYLYS